jgi:hypothetical protein
MTAITAAGRPEMIGFTLTHSMLRAELDVLARSTVTPANREVFEDHLRLVTDHLVRHEQEEDEFHFRLLQDRAPGEGDRLDRLTDEHRQIDDRLLVVRDTSVGLADRIDALRDLRDRVLRHLDEEDTAVIPRLEDHITPAEQSGSMARSRSKIPPEDELRVLACMLDAASEAERSRMLAPLPAEVEQLWRTLAAPQLAAVHAQLLG